MLVVFFASFFIIQFAIRSSKQAEESVSSTIKEIWSTEETSEDADVELPSRLTVNPSYDGTNKEYIYNSVADTEAVTRIHQTINYQYYDENGSAIKVVETKTYNARGEILFSGYRRENCKMPNINVTRQEIEISYRYDEEKIYRDYWICSYSDTAEPISASESSEKNRT